MNWKRKAFLIPLLILTLLLVGCSEDATPYQKNDDAGYCVSVKFDANGGTFTTNTWVITDAYNLSQLPKDGSGKAMIALLSPDDPIRGSTNAYTPVRSGYFLAGWYTQCTENADGTCTYSGKWDFEKDVLTLDPALSYSSETPVLTLYAAWVPLFEINFYDMEGNLLLSKPYNPLEDGELTMPSWKDAAIHMGNLPEKSGFTFENAYYDAAGTQKVLTPTLSHSGSVDLLTGTAKEPVMNIYMDFIPGTWYHIYTAEQFLDNASVAGCYVIHEDLDFEGKIWPSSLMYGSFSGTIEGNGHTLRNISLKQTNNSKTNAGLFGQLTDQASISDLKLENVSFTIEKGARMAGTCYGLLAGTLSPQAQLSGITVTGSQLLIDSGCYFGTDDYSIGLLCGMGEAAIDCSGITCAATGDKPETVSIEISGNTVNVTFTAQ